jgi:alkanesulfonate monooxygenase SsuD/methylene tetrahydromethanopterin reductase-like flavin-dependent oxidoreductase (luciferase family)
LVDLYRQAGKEAGHKLEDLRVGLHSLGYVAESKEIAVKDYYEGYAKNFTKIGKERGWPPVTRAHFDEQTGPMGALVIGSPEEVAQKIVRHSQALGGISRFTFQLDNAGSSHTQLIKSIELIGKEVIPLVKKYERIASV